MKQLSSFKKILLIIGIVGIAFAAFAGPWAYKNRLQVIQSPIVRHFIPMYRSLSKVTDVVFFPYTQFRETELEEFEIFITPQNFQMINDALPENPFGLLNTDSLTDERKVWARATFVADDYNDNVKIRYRGNQASHWNSFKKSMLIEFPDDNLFRGMRRMTLVIPSDRRYISMHLNNARARKLGLNVPQESFTKVSLNGVNHGVYLTFEGWSQEMIEKWPVSALSTLYGVDEPTSENLDKTKVYTPEGAFNWKSWNSELIVFPEIQALIEIANHADDEDFARYLGALTDIDAFHARDVVSLLSGDFHSAGDNAGANNLVLLFDRTEGRFKPVPYNTSIFTYETRNDGLPTQLQRRMFSNLVLRAERDELLRIYIEQEKEDDIVILDDIIATLKPELLSDTAKAQTNFGMLSDLRKLRQVAIDNFDDPFELIPRDWEPDPFIQKGELKFTDSFVYLHDAVQTPEAFVAQYPEFRLTKEGLFLPSGTYRFSETIIVPYGTSLTIAPATRILMGEDASFVTYSPLTMEGTEVFPIQVAPLTERAWGVFAVMNTKEASSTIMHANFEGGGEAEINGAYISGMLALHNANGSVDSVRIARTTGDDGINVKTGYVTVTNTEFIENVQDGIDIDFPDPRSTVSYSTFIDNGGDSIDLSWCDCILTDNIIIRSGDKGVSAGERSNPIIQNTIIVGSVMGVASKDQSNVTIENTLLLNNKSAIAAYQKKPFFGAAHARMKYGVVMGNKRETFIQDTSEVVFEDVENVVDVTTLRPIVQEALNNSPNF